MVSILPYKFNPESDPETGNKESQAEPPQTHDSYKTFLNGTFFLL